MRQRGAAVPTDPESVDFIQSLPSAFLDCRDYGHTWRARTARWDGDTRAYERTLECSRCSTTRTQWLSAFGTTLKGSYSYPDGYTHTGMGRLDGAARDALRLETVTRLLDLTPATVTKRRSASVRRAS